MALLSSWTVLVRRQEISPCEAWMVLTIASSFLLPLAAAIHNPFTVDGEGIGIFLGIMSMIWINTSATWFCKLPWERIISCLYSDLLMLSVDFERVC
jgi:hypothetical protein